jgi:putative FmdB family regulatory protein
MSMPIYEYECVKCGSQKELMQRISEATIPKCDACKSRMKRLISQSSFHLKGTGWYVTDYASKGVSEKKKSSGSEKESKDKDKETKASTVDKPKVDASPSTKNV